MHTKTTDRAIRIFLVDDHPIVRQGLTELITPEGDLCVCGEAEDVAGALALLPDSQADMVIADISLRDSNGIELIKDIKLRYPRMPILVLSMHDESFYVERCLRAGAMGYITKEEATDGVIAAIRKVLSGEIYLSEKMASKVLTKLVGGQSGPGGLSVDTLTDRELQVFEMIGVGISTRIIADKLHLSAKTVESHRENIKRKLQLGSAAELLQHAIQWCQTQGG